MTEWAVSAPPGSAPTAVQVSELRALLGGRVISPGDAGYDAARGVYYDGIDRSPAVVAQVADADVSRVATIARENGLELAVKSGGYGLADHGTTEGGIPLDLSAMKGLEIDVSGRSAWAHAGLTVDGLLAAEVATADGELALADSENHPDLFWAIRGGGVNFGVATRLRFRLHEVGTVVVACSCSRPRQRRSPRSRSSWRSWASCFAPYGPTRTSRGAWRRSCGPFRRVFS